MYATLMLCFHWAQTGACLDPIFVRSEQSYLDVVACAQAGQEWSRRLKRRPGWAPFVINVLCLSDEYGRPLPADSTDRTPDGPQRNPS